jgi:hypothetical protein
LQTPFQTHPFSAHLFQGKGFVAQTTAPRLCRERADRFNEVSNLGLVRGDLTFALDPTAMFGSQANESPDKEITLRVEIPTIYSLLGMMFPSN